MNDLQLSAVFDPCEALLEVFCKADWIKFVVLCLKDHCGRLDLAKQFGHEGFPMLQTTKQHQEEWGRFVSKC